jgi:hypothetical protein
MYALERYLSLARKPRRTEKESGTLFYDGNDLMKTWARALERSANDEQAAAFLDTYAKVFADVYEIIVSCHPPLLADLEQEARRLTQALIQYYNRLATLPHLTAERLQVFEKIDALLRSRFFSINLNCLFEDDKREIAAIAEALNIEITRSHYVLSLEREVTRQDGWYTDRRSYGGTN